jgi:hypothetical protein
MKSWKWLVGLFILLAVGDGALRKWVMPSQSLVLFVLKDVLLAGAFGLYALDRNPFQFPRPLKNTWFPLLLGLYVYVVVLQAFNFTQPNLAVRALGLKAHLAYLPLLFMMPALLASLRRWSAEQLLFGYMILVALPVMVLGIYQFFQPTNAWINRYVGGTESVVGVSGHPRITGTFSYIGGMTSFIGYNTLLGFGILVGGFMTQRRWVTWTGAVFLGLCVVVSTMTGSRGLIVFNVLLTGGVSVVLLRRRRGGISALLGMAFAVGIAFLLFTQTDLSEGLTTIQDRFDNASDTEKRIETTLTSPIRGISRAGIFGYGVGSLHQAASRLARGSTGDWVPLGYVENGIVRIIFELGAIGWLVLLALKGTIAWMAYQALQRAQTVFEFAVATVALGKGTLHIFFPVVFNVTTGITYWASVGLLLYVWSCQELRVGGNRTAKASSRSAGA